MVIALSDLGSPVLLSDLYWQDASGAAQPVYYLDDIEVVSETSQSSALPDATGDRVLGQSMLTTQRIRGPDWRSFMVRPAWPSDLMDVSLLPTTRTTAS